MKGQGKAVGGGERVARDALTAYGERFMSMFDDYDAKPKAQKKRDGSKAGGGDDNGSAAEPNRMSQKTSGLNKQQPGHVNPSGLTGPQAPPLPAAKKQRKSASSFEIDQIMSGLASSGKVQEAAGVKVARQRGPGSLRGPGGGPRPDPRAERKAFMSSKPEKIEAGREGDTPDRLARGPQNGTGDVLDMSNLSSEEFKKIQMEVERLGASELGKKEKKKWQAQMLARLGAKVEKGQRMGSKKGIGIAKKQAEREAKALEEAMAAGMVKRKGYGQKMKKMAEKGKKIDRGLEEMPGRFKNGVLRIKK